MRANLSWIILGMMVIVGMASPAWAAAGGDVYQIKSITFPQLYQWNPISADVNIVNIRNADQGNYPLSNASNLTIRIRKEDGTLIVLSSYPVTWSVAGAPSQIISIPIDSANSPTLTVGETYTLYASLPAYNGTNYETVTANNAASRTFTVIKPPASIPVPDNAPWMSMLMVFVVAGWLYLSTNQKK